MNKRPAFWQLPPGVSRGTWDYVQSQSIASDYERDVGDSPLLKFDLEFIKLHLPPATGPDSSEPLRVADLGCGTGRVARQLLPAGYRLLNIDLSEPMLQRAQQLTESELPAAQASQAEYLQANLVELDSVPQNSVDAAVCLFSSLGMIRGHRYRSQCLQHVARITKPGGTLILHAHNRNQHWTDPGGPWWLLRTWWQQRRGGEMEYGDRVYQYRGLPSMYLHTFSRRELSGLLGSAGFQRVKFHPLNRTGSGALQSQFLFSRFRAGGYMVTAINR